MDFKKTMDKAIKSCDVNPFIIEAKKGNSIMKSIMNFESKEDAEKYLKHKGFEVISIKEAYHK